MTDPLELVPRPRDLDRAGLIELAQGYSDHTGALVNARHGIGRQEPAGRLRSSALDSLAIGEQIRERMTNHRWLTASEALRYGATVEMVARAVGMPADVVIECVASWANRQHELWLSEDGAVGITAKERDEILGLLPEVTA